MGERQKGSTRMSQASLKRALTGNNAALLSNIIPIFMGCH